MSSGRLPILEEVRKRLMTPLTFDERRGEVHACHELLDNYEVARPVSDQKPLNHYTTLRELVDELDYERPSWQDIEQQEDSLSSIQEKIDYLEQVLKKDEQLVKESVFDSLVQAGQYTPPFRMFLRLRIAYLTKSKKVGTPPLLNASTLTRSSDDWYLPDSIPDDVKEKVFNVGKGMQTRVYSAVAEEAFQEVKCESEKDQSRRRKWEYLIKKQREAQRTFLGGRLVAMIDAEANPLDPRQRGAGLHGDGHRDARPWGTARSDGRADVRTELPPGDETHPETENDQPSRLVGTETNWRHLARASAILLNQKSVTSKERFFEVALEMQHSLGLHTSKSPGEAIWKGVSRLGRAALGLKKHEAMPSRYYGIEGFKLLVNDLIQGTLSKEDNEKDNRTKERQEDK